jgi:hypothetical protein
MAVNIKQIIREELVHHKINEHINRAKESVNEAKFNFSEPAVRRAAALLAKAMEKVDGVKIKVHDFEWDEGKGAGFDLSWDGDKHDGGSYGISDKGEVINHAYPGKPVYGNIKSSARDFEKGIRKYSKRRNESVNEAKAEPIVDLLDQGKWANGMGEKKLVKLSDAFDAIGDEQADAIASHLNMAIELMQEREKKSAVPHMNKFNKACVKELKLMKKQGLAESVNEGQGKLSDKDLEIIRQLIKDPNAKLTSTERKILKKVIGESVNEAKLPKRFTVKTKQTLNDTTYNIGTYALKKKRAGGGIYLNMDNNQMLGVSAGDIAKLSEDTLDEMQVINKKTGKDVTKHMLAYMQGKITKEKFEKLTGLSKEKIKVSEDTKYLQVAELLKQAAKGTREISEDNIAILREKLVFYVDKKGKKRRFDTDATANKKYNKS